MKSPDHSRYFTDEKPHRHKEVAQLLRAERGNVAKWGFTPRRPGSRASAVKLHDIQLLPGWKVASARRVLKDLRPLYLLNSIGKK